MTLPRGGGGIRKRRRSQGSLCIGQDSNQASAEYKSNGVIVTLVLSVILE
jgi:hypothetical protein